MSEENEDVSRRQFLQAAGAASAVAIAGCQGNPPAQETQTTPPETEAPETATPTPSGMAETETPTETATPGETETPAEDMGGMGKRVRAVSGTIDTLDPIKSTDTTSGGKVQNIFDALTNYPDGQTNVKALLAKDFSVSSDGTKWTFTLKEGATYNNGDEVTAQDAVYAFERLAASPNSRRKGFILNDLGIEHETTAKGNYKSGTLAVEATGDYTLEVTLSEPFHASLEMLAYSAFSLVPEGIVGDISGYQGEMDYQTFAKENPVGAGPYTLDSWESGTSMSLSAREDYHGETPRNSGIDYEILTQSNAIYTYATVNVNADFPYIPPSRFKRKLRNIEKTDKRGRRVGTYGPFEPHGMTVPYYEVPTLSTFYTAFNCEKVPRPVRRAFAFALSQKEVAEVVIGGIDKPAYFFTPPGIFPNGGDNYNQLAKEFPYGYGDGATKLQAARAEMKAAGYNQTNQYELALDMPAFTASAWGQDYFSLMRDKLQTAFIDLSLRTAKWSTFLNRGRDGKFEAHFLGWIADYPAPDNFLQLLYPPMTDTESDQFLSYVNWNKNNGEFADEAIQAWKQVENNPRLTEKAQAARNEAYLQIERANWRDAVLLPMIHGISQHYRYPWVEAPRDGAMGSSRSKDHTISIGDRGKWA